MEPCLHRHGRRGGRARGRAPSASCCRARLLPAVGRPPEMKVLPRRPQHRRDGRRRGVSIASSGAEALGRRVDLTVPHLPAAGRKAVADRLPGVEVGANVSRAAWLGRFEALHNAMASRPARCSAETSGRFFVAEAFGPRGALKNRPRPPGFDGKRRPLRLAAQPLRDPLRRRPRGRRPFHAGRLPRRVRHGALVHAGARARQPAPRARPVAEAQLHGGRTRPRRRALRARSPAPRSSEALRGDARDRRRRHRPAARPRAAAGDAAPPPRRPRRAHQGSARCRARHGPSRRPAGDHADRRRRRRGGGSLPRGGGAPRPRGSESRSSAACPERRWSGSMRRRTSFCSRAFASRPAGSSSRRCGGGLPGRDRGSRRAGLHRRRRVRSRRAGDRPGADAPAILPPPSRPLPTIPPFSSGSARGRWRGWRASALWSERGGADGRALRRDRARTGLARTCPDNRP